MKRFLRIVTQARHSYIVRVEDGNMAQYRYNTEPSCHHFSGGWKFVGLSHTKMRLMVSLEKICNDPDILDRISLRYKNGKGQYTVIDYDHGTIREWGDRVISIGWISE